MKYLKKVSASQLISNTGTIIDSMNPGDDQTVNAPSIHAVKDYVKNYVENYSTTEKVIGMWIDGKPIYKKTIESGTINIQAGITTIAHGIANFKACIKAEAIFDGENYMLPYQWAGSPVKITNINYVSTTQIAINSTSAWGNAKLIVTLYYTKTTD